MGARFTYVESRKAAEYLGDARKRRSGGAGHRGSVPINALASGEPSLKTSVSSATRGSACNRCLAGHHPRVAARRLPLCPLRVDYGQRETVPTVGKLEYSDIGQPSPGSSSRKASYAANSQQVTLAYPKNLTAMRCHQGQSCPVRSPQTSSQWGICLSFKMAAKRTLSFRQTSF